MNDEKRNRNIARYWEKVNKLTEPPQGLPEPCWLWQGAIDKDGYPRFKMNSKSLNAKRAIYDLTGNPLTPDLHIVCICGDRRCIRPEHNLPGTRTDCLFFGRGVKIGHYVTKYGIGEVYLARLQYAKGNLTPDQLSLAWELSLPFCRLILRETSYSEIV
ncbi:MAG: hypothetical protein R3261_11840 [Alphaproteobacteria bacterium]|nr:hypothetical protein [Alphaproteobacteria bacterium]